MIAFGRMNRILKWILENRSAVVQPGVVNFDLTPPWSMPGFISRLTHRARNRAPSAATVSENSGGPHTLAYGVTTNHVTGLELVLPDGEIKRIGGKLSDSLGYDLCGLLVGSEGTLALVT